MYIMYIYIILGYSGAASNSGTRSNPLVAGLFMLSHAHGLALAMDAVRRPSEQSARQSAAACSGRLTKHADRFSLCYSLYSSVS